MTRKPLTLILLGDIAAGKGTQAKILARKFKLKLIDTGAYSRRILTGRTKVSKRLERMKLGKLAPSDIIQEYLKNKIAKIKSQEGVLLDGGKMPAEARLISNLLREKNRLPQVVYLSIPKKEVFRRLRWRYYCQKTGQPLVINGRRGNLLCPHCGGPIIKRADDDPKAVRNRIAYYDQVYRKTVRFWQSKKVLRKVRGMGPVNQVTKRITKVIHDLN